MHPHAHVLSREVHGIILKPLFTSGSVSLSLSLFPHLVFSGFLSYSSFPAKGIWNNKTWWEILIFFFFLATDIHACTGWLPDESLVLKAMSSSSLCCAKIVEYKLTLTQIVIGSRASISLTFNLALTMQLPLQKYCFICMTAWFLPRCEAAAWSQTK